MPKKDDKAPATITEFVTAIEQIAPTALAQQWDNVGLLCGDMRQPLRRALLCIDLTPPVVEEARQGKTDLILAYHPPLFKPISRLHGHGAGTDALVFQCIRHGIAIYSTHTALDAVGGGTNEVLAELCGLSDLRPFEYVDSPGASEFKLVVFVPESDLDRVSNAMFDAGAGHIGEYSHCSYRTQGKGSFLGSENTSPTIGVAGRLEFADETRLETVVSQPALPAVIRAMVEAHSYEEPAYDVYPLKKKPTDGIGRIGAFAKPTTLSALANKLKRSVQARCVQTVGEGSQSITRAIILVGAAGTMPLTVGAGMGDVIVTGEIRHHDALAIGRAGCGAIALGHWASERPVLAPLSSRLGTLMRGVEFAVSESDCDPFEAV